MLLVERHRVSKITQLNHALMHVAVELQDQLTQSLDQRQLPLGNWYTTEQPYSLDITGPHGHQGKLTVELARLADAEGRPTYRYAIHDSKGRLLETRADLDGPDRPSNETAMDLLISHLGKAARALSEVQAGGPRSKHLDLFTWPVIEFAHDSAEALEIAQLELGLSAVTGVLER
jgi:hypothetical protein